MSERPLVTVTDLPHSSAEKLYRQDLAACIEGIERFHFTQRLDSNGSHVPVLSFASVAVSSPAPVDPSTSLPSPPQSPSRRAKSSSGPESQIATSSMNRSVHADPARGNAGPSSVRQPLSQDARTYVAVQPATGPAPFKFKRNVVKIVGAADARPAMPHLKATTSPIDTPALLTSVPEVASKTVGLAKENGQPKVPEPIAESSSSRPVVKLQPKKIELPSQTHTSSLEDMFARLSTSGTLVPSRPAGERTLAGPDKSFFSFRDFAKTEPTASDVSSSKIQPEMVKTPEPSDNKRIQDKSAYIDFPSTNISWHGELQNVHDTTYLHKAGEYFASLPSHPGSNKHIFDTVATNLRTAFSSDQGALATAEVERLRARLVFAIITYVNKKVKTHHTPLTADFVKSVLQDSQGSFLQLCSALVKDKYIALDDIDHVVNLCQYMLDVLPKADINTAIDEPKKTTIPVVTATNTSKNVLEDPLEATKAWPAQEKREHGAVYRTCIIKGTSGIKSLHQLQALVWGGRLESLALPATGSEHAVVTFLTPEACKAYLDATENGIEIQGDTKNTVVFVDKHAGPTSINDVIQNCIDGDASRCIRATGADDDWSDGALFLLARGKQVIPRDVDCIKQGKTNRGHHYIEFRFGNIYHALNFKRYLLSDEEWEHCTISYAPDPCELACGVHYKDADE